MTEKSTVSLRNPLSKAQGLGSAKEGAHHWWMQRVTAVALIPLCLFFLTQIPQIVTGDYQAFINWMHLPYVAIAMLLFIVVSFYHGALGVQVIIEDYVHGECCKIASLLLNKLFFFFLGFAAVYAVLTINFGIHG